MVYEMNEVLDDLKKGKFIRTQISGEAEAGKLKIDKVNDMRIGKLVEV